MKQICAPVLLHLLQRARVYVKIHIMFREDLKDKYQFLTEYFERGLQNENRALAHSILLYGQDIQAQYDLALEIARLLNCNELKNESCQCLNCKWIRGKEHPAVLTVSRIDNKPSDDDSKTVISVKQSQMIKNSLLNTSEYHRVFIFCDAEMENEKWVPHGLNQNNFQEKTANSMLKIIEEPPANTTFFFLTRDKKDLLETIISRSQSFFVPSFSQEERSYSNIENLLEDYPQIERKTSLDLAQKLFLTSKEIGSEKVLGQIQCFLVELAKSNIENNQLKMKILTDIKHTETAQKQIENHINPQLAFEDMCLNLTQH